MSKENLQLNNKFKMKNFITNQRDIAPGSAPLILAIDTSCDDTSAAVTLGNVVLSNVVASQTDVHAPHGGVFPTLAKQAHRENIEPTTNKSLLLAGVDLRMLDAIAVTVGPGLAPALEIGIEYAEKLANDLHKPLFGINHLEAHLLSVLATRNHKCLNTKKYLKQKGLDSIPDFKFKPDSVFHQKTIFPVLGLIFSGGHSQFVQINDIGQYKVLGETIDDALGEALDKVGRMLGLGYPAGPVIEQLAKKGDKNSFSFPLPMTTSDNFNLSYSGLKTAAHRLIKSFEKKQLTKQDIHNFSASFQEATFRHLCYKLEKLLVKNNTPKFSEVWLGGGVANNIYLRQKIRVTINSHHLKLKTPYSKKLCSDNAAMIGVTAGLRIMNNSIKPIADPDRKPSWMIGEP